MNYEKYLAQAGVSDPSLRQQAVDYLLSCEQKYKQAKITKHKLTAWFVIGKLLLQNKVPFEAETLPEKYKNYDNDVSINGDRGEWLWENNQGGTYAVMQPVPLDDSAMPLCYYAEGHHPRSNYARWIWLGFRNMASKLAFDSGPEITPEMRPRLRQWGDPATDRNHPGVLVQEVDGHWSIYVVEPWYFGLVIRRNMGVKLGLAVNGLRRRASLVMIKFSLIRGK